MQRNYALGPVLLAMCLASFTMNNATAQESGGKPAEASEPGHAYRVDFLISEIDDGKKINTRQYALNLNAGDNDEMKIGTRVPVEVKQSEIQYLDVGTSLWCRLRDRGWANFSWLGNDVMLNIRAEISNFAMPDQQNSSMRPVIRQMKVESSTIAAVGKQMVVGVVDDPNSKRQFQVEVTVSKLK